MSDTGPDGMVVWLRAAMDAAQNDAEAAGGDEWRRQDHPSDTVAVYDSKGEPVVYDEGSPTEAQQAHIVRHSPAAVLRRIAADRKQLAEHPVHVYEAFGPRCETCQGGMVQMSSGPIDAGQPFPCTTIRNLAEGWGWTEEEQR